MVEAERKKERPKRKKQGDEESVRVGLRESKMCFAGQSGGVCVNQFVAGFR